MQKNHENKTEAVFVWKWILRNPGGKKLRASGEKEAKE